MVIANSFMWPYLQNGMNHIEHADIIKTFGPLNLHRQSNCTLRLQFLRLPMRAYFANLHLLLRFSRKDYSLANLFLSVIIVETMSEGILFIKFWNSRFSFLNLFSLFRRICSHLRRSAVIDCMLFSKALWFFIENQGRILEHQPCGENFS